MGPIFITLYIYGRRKPALSKEPRLFSLDQIANWRIIFQAYCEEPKKLQANWKMIFVFSIILIFQAYCKDPVESQANWKLFIYLFINLNFLQLHCNEHLPFWFSYNMTQNVDHSSHIFEEKTCFIHIQYNKSKLVNVQDYMYKKVGGVI